MEEFKLAGENVKKMRDRDRIFSFQSESIDSPYLELHLQDGSLHTMVRPPVNRVEGEFVSITGRYTDTAPDRDNDNSVARRRATHGLCKFDRWRGYA